MTYNEFVNAMTVLAATTGTDTRFLNVLPRAIEYAENRIFRDFKFITQTQADSSSTLTINNRLFTLPASPYFIELQQVNVITPSTQANPVLGSRNQLEPSSREFLDAVWNSATGASVPQFFAMLTDTSFIVGPWPDAAYTVELVGFVRPASLSADTPSTFLSKYLPELLQAAAMIFVAGSQRDYGAQSDDPQLAQSWESQYKTLAAGADAEEMRRKFATQKAS